MLFWEFKELSNIEKDKAISLYSISDLSTGKELVVGQANVGTNEKDSYIEGKAVANDARPVIIRKYLQKYNSPLEPYSDLIFELSQTYGFDYSYILAIGQQESNLCKKIPENSFNCWGYGIHKEGTLGFDNYEIALKSFAEYLKREYFDKGYTTPEEMMKKYCPHSNGSWAFGVQHFIDEIKNGDFLE
jgi:hypothetical protein